MLNRKQKALLLAIFLLLITVSGCIKDSVQTDEFTRSINATSGSVVHISNLNGPVRVNEWDGDTVEMTVQRTAYFGGREELDKVNIVITENGKEIWVEVDYPLYGTESLTVGMELNVPKDVAIKILETPDADL